MSNTLTPENLAENGYELKDKLIHSELLPFVQTYLRKKNSSTIVYFIINLLFFVNILWLIVNQFFLPASLGFLEMIGYLSYGVLLAFLLIPLHEYLHLLAYKYFGAKETSLAADWKKFYFMAIAHKFVATQKAFIIIAICPFVVISSLLIVASLVVAMPYQLTFASCLLMHTAMCSGDFGLLSYCTHTNNKSLVTYDDAVEKISYFYIKKG